MALLSSTLSMAVARAGECGTSGGSGIRADRPPVPPTLCDGRRAADLAGRVAGYGIQYWGDDYAVASLADAPHCALIVEPSTHGAGSRGEAEILFSRDEVSRLRHEGARPVFAYLNVGEAAPYRDYWAGTFVTGDDGAPASPGKGTVPPWYAGQNEGGEHLAAFWRSEWRAILERRIDALLERGYDGVFLDDVLHYFTWGQPPRLTTPGGNDVAGGPESLGESARSMMELVLALGAYARSGSPSARQDFLILVNGAVFIGWDAASSGSQSPSARDPVFDAYTGAIDGIAIESALSEALDTATLEEMKQGYAARGLALLSIDYKSRRPDLSDAAFRELIRDRAEEHGFLPYIADDQLLDDLGPPLFTMTASAPMATSCAQSRLGAVAPDPAAP